MEKRTCPECGEPAEYVDGLEVSSPRIDWSWGFRGEPGSEDWRDAEPRRRTPSEIRRTLRSAPWQPHVLLPHAVAVLIGLLLFVLSGWIEISAAVLTGFTLAILYFHPLLMA